MDNFETYLYIIIGVVYLVSRVIKARKKAVKQRPIQQGTQPRSADTPSSPKPRKTFSFEDILKEFEKNFEDEDLDAPATAPVKRMEEETQRQEPTPMEKKPGPYESYEGASYKSPKVKIAPPQASASFERSEKYSIREQVVSDYVKMLRDPDGFKNAIVLSEIINRKYF